MVFRTLAPVSIGVMTAFDPVLLRESAHFPSALLLPCLGANLCEDTLWERRIL